MENTGPTAVMYEHTEACSLAGAFAQISGGKVCRHAAVLASSPPCGGSHRRGDDRQATSALSAPLSLPLAARERRKTETERRKTETGSPLDAVPVVRVGMLL